MGIFDFFKFKNNSFSLSKEEAETINRFYSFIKSGFDVDYHDDVNKTAAAIYRYSFKRAGMRYVSLDEITPSSLIKDPKIYRFFGFYKAILTNLLSIKEKLSYSVKSLSKQQFNVIMINFIVKCANQLPKFGLRK